VGFLKCSKSSLNGHHVPEVKKMTSPRYKRFIRIIMIIKTNLLFTELLLLGSQRFFRLVVAFGLRFAHVVVVVVVVVVAAVNTLTQRSLTPRRGPAPGLLALCSRAAFKITTGASRASPAPQNKPPSD